jgi:hypothetical protein
MALESRACGLLGEVACSGSARERAGGAGPALPAFADGEGARHAIGLPVVVGGAVVAVLYADAEIGNGAPAGWPDRLGAVTRHASRVLEALTLHQAVARRAKRPGRR